MNTIYRIVWNATTGKWVVASELAKGRKKKASRLSLAVAAITLASASGAVIAQTATNPAGQVGAGGSANVAVGQGSSASCVTPSSGAIKNSSYVNGTCVNGTAVGNNAQGVQGGTAIGDSAVTSGALGTAVGAYSSASANGTALGVSSIAGTSATAVGYNATASTASSVAIGSSSTATGQAGNIAIGNGAKSNVSTSYQYSSLAIGSNAASSGNGSVALGTNTSATGSGAVALGVNSTSAGGAGVAIGTSAKASGSSGTAIGSYAASSATDSTALGVYANAAATDSTALGYSSTVQSGATNSVALGTNSVADRADTVSVGSSTAQRQIEYVAAGTQGTDAANVNQLTTNRGINIALGNYTAPVAGDVGDIAIGQDAVASSPYINGGDHAATAIGFGAQATDARTVALGMNADAATADAAAVGYNAQATGNSSVALGANSVANQDNVVSVGNTNAGGQRQIVNMAAGVAATDAVNVSQLTPVVNSLGGGASIDPTTGAVTGPTYNVQGGTQTTVGGALNTLDSGLTTAQSNITNLQNSTNAASHYFKANGQNDGSDDASAAGTGSIAIGANAKTTYGLATAIGNASTASGPNTVALGNSAKASNSAATALGDSALASGVNSTAVGQGAQAFLDGSVAVGQGAQASGSNAMALGTNASTTALTSNAVALGANSVADRANTVSVGSSTAQRQIEYVAAGTQSTDAVNVSQLAPVVAGLGGGASIDPNTGSVTGPTYNVQGGTQTSVGDALTSLDGGLTTAQGDITNLQAASADAVMYDDSTHTSVTLGGTSATSPVGLHNVAAGTANTDAVNISQLAPVVAGLGGGASINPTTGAVTGPTYNVQGGTQTTVGSALDALDSGLTTAQSNITSLQNSAGAAASPYFKANGLNNGTDNASATGVNAVAAGASANSQGAGAVALGGNANALADYSIAIGGASTAGNGAMASGLRSISMGVLSNASGDYSIAQGSNAEASGTYAIALGGASTAGNGAQAIGTSSVAMGVASQAKGDYSIAQGMSATASGAYSIAQGMNATASGTYSIALGGASSAANGAQATGADSVAIGVVSKASTANSVAMGPYSSASGTTATALGYNTKASGANSVALGAGSVSERSGTVSVGSDVAGSSFTRQIVNVGAGTQATDAVNVSQLKPVVQALGGGASIDPTTGAVTGPTYNVQGTTQTTVGGALTTLDNSVTNNTTNISNLTSQVNNGTVGLVQQAAPGANLTVGKDTDGTAVDFADKNGNTRTLSNVSAGVADTDAVNVSQLKSTGLVDANGNTVAAVTYDQNNDGTPNYNSVTMGGGKSSGPVAIHNVAPGALSSTSTDAVNGSQLYATNQQVSQNTTDISNLQASSADGVMYDDSTHNGVTLGGTSATSPVGLHNVAAGTASTDAVNVSQLAPVVAGLGGGASIDPTTGAVTGPTYNVQGGTQTTVGGALTALDTSVTNNTTNISNLTSQVNSGTVGLVQQAAPGANLTVGKDTDGTAVDFADKDGNTRTLSNVSAGVADTDAVNVSQLKSTGLIDANGNTMAAVTYDQNANGTPNYSSVTMGGGKSTGPVQIHNVAAGTDDDDAVNVGQLNSSLAQSGLVDGNGNALDAVTYDPGTNRGVVTLGGVGASAPVTLTNVANGVNQYDAVNFGQLQGVEAGLQSQINNIGGQVTNIDGRVTNIETTNATPAPPAGSSSGSVSDDGSNLAVGSGSNASGGSSVAVGNDSTATGGNSTAVGNNASSTASNGTAVGSGSTVAPAATGGTAVGSGSSVNASNGTALGQGATVQSGATNSVALGSGSVATTANTVSVGSAGNERTISNVAPGVNATDAANVGQVNAVQNWAQSYVDQKASQLNSRITSVGQHADAGTAAAIAMTNIPQAYQPNQSSVGAGVGAFNGQAAVAVGMSTITPNGRWVLKGSLTGNTQGAVGVGFGASMVW